MVEKTMIETVKSGVQGITLTATAKQHIQQQLEKRDACLGVRFSVGKTGCSGLSYLLDYAEHKNADDKHFEVDGLTIYIQKKSYPYLKGLNVDYVKQGLNQKFIFTNPNQTGECGCGESFTVDDDLAN